MKIKLFIFATVVVAGSLLLAGCADSVDAEAARAAEARNAQTKQMKDAGVGGKSPESRAEKSVDMAAKAGPGGGK